jgi:hypothetical protein
MEFVGSHKSYNNLGNRLVSGRPTRGGLPENVLIEALSGYGERGRSWSDLLARRTSFEQFLKLNMPEVQTAGFIRKSVSTKKACTAVSAYHVNVKQVDGSEGLFGALVDTFVFRHKSVWHLQSNDPVVATGHIYRRAMQRSGRPLVSLAEFHQSMSILWPAFLELGTRRRLSGRPGGVAQFAFPFWGGLAMGELLVQQNTPFHGPEMWIYEQGRRWPEQLQDNLASKQGRLMVQGKTFLDRRSTKVANLADQLEDFIRRHSSALAHLSNTHRYALYGTSSLVNELQAIFSPTKQPVAEVSAMLDGLEEISTSELWLSVVNKANQPASDKVPGDPQGTDPTC